MDRLIGLQTGAAFRRAADAVLGPDLADAVERTLLLLEDTGLKGLDEDRKARLRTRFAAFAEVQVRYWEVPPEFLALNPSGVTPVLVETRLRSGNRGCSACSTPLMWAITTPAEVVPRHLALISSSAGRSSPASQLKDRVTQCATVIMG